MCMERTMIALTNAGKWITLLDAANYQCRVREIGKDVAPFERLISCMVILTD